MLKSNLFYNMNTNKIIDEKFNRNKNFNKLIRLQDKFNDDNINSLNNILDICHTSDDIISLIKCIPFDNHYCIYNILFSYLCLLTKLTSYDDIIGNDEIKYLFNTNMKSIEEFFNDDPSLYDSKEYSYLLNNIGHYTETINRIIDDITTDYVYYLSPKEKNDITVSVNENVSVSEADDDSRSISYNYMQQEANPDECIKKLICDIEDYDVFVHNIRYLYGYLKSLNGNFNDNNSKAFVDALNYIFSKIINDITAKELLIDILEKCDILLTNSITDVTEYRDNIEIMIRTIDNIIDHINEYPDGTTSLMDEMGLGYFYECPDSLEETVTYLNECAENFDIISILNESIKDNIKKYKDKVVNNHKKKVEYKDKKRNEKYEFFDDTKDTRRDIYDKTQQDDYELDKQKKQDTYDDDREFANRKRDDSYGDKREFKNQKKQDKYDFKQQKKQDKYDFKRQKKLDKWEQKKSIDDEKRELAERKRQERLEARQRKRDETKIGINRWKTLELTNANVFKAVNALKKCVKAGAVGGTAALAGLNPIFAGSAYLLKSYKNDKTHPMKMQQKYAEDIKLQINDIDEKIAAADSRGETDKRIALSKMRKKLEIAYNNINPVTKMKADQIGS